MTPLIGLVTSIHLLYRALHRKDQPNGRPILSLMPIPFYSTDFISALVIANKCLSYLLALTRSLQAEAKDIVQAVSEIDNLMSVLLDVRENVETHHGTWFTEVEKKCEAVGTEPSLPRLCGRQSHRSNTPAQTPSEYYRCTMTIPVLDHLLSDVKSRFSEHLSLAGPSEAGWQGRLGPPHFS